MKIENKKWKISLVLLLLSVSSCFGLRADMNNDGQVNLLDLAILAEEWLMSNQYLNTTSTSYRSITVPSHGTINPGNAAFSIGFWAKLNALNAGVDITKKPMFGAGYKVALIWGGLGCSVSAKTFTSEDNVYQDLSDFFTASSDWFFVVAVFEPAHATKIYVNAVEQTHQLTSSWQEQSLDSTAALYIGLCNAGIDALRVYKRKLYSDEIDYLYNGGLGRLGLEFSAQFGVPVAFNFDESSGETTYSEGAAVLAGTFSSQYITRTSGGIPFGIDLLRSSTRQPIEQNRQQNRIWRLNPER